MLPNISLKYRVFLSTGFILTVSWLTACSINGVTPGKQSSHLVYGVECVIMKYADDTYYIVEKPQSNDEKEWKGTDPSLRRQWVRADHGETAGRILADELNEHEFLDARVSIRIPEDGGVPCIDDIWDDELISADAVKELGLLEDSIP